MSLRHRVGALGSTALSILRTRLEIFALEAGEQKASLIRLLALFAGALLFATLAILVFSLWIALLFWPTEYRYWAIGILMAVYGVLAIVFSLRIVRRLTQEPMPFAVTIDELGRDIQLLDRLRAEDKDS
ncbi:phage holin family protein [Paenalcaligenes hominis]|uniref:phage holin family protein n=1 Tax=Paenalcaligenes hominis TaxID=643674 RepID=UPI003525B49D